MNFTDFFSGVNLVYIVGILSGIISALWAYQKFLYEKKLEKFKDANNNLFKQDKQEVLAAIATLGIFKSDRNFEKNTIDVLLSRLYTELDYDITNAIASVLIQYSNRRELQYIAAELADINRNFFYQSSPVDQMYEDLQLQLKNTKETESKTDTLIEKEVLNDIKAKLNAEFKLLYSKKHYELLWHKQITANTYSRILRKASRKKLFFGGSLGVTMNLYQNDFNFASLANIKVSSCTMERTAVSEASIADLEIMSVKKIENNTFAKSRFHKCHFRNGVMTGNVFQSAIFYNTVFENIRFEDTFFWDAEIRDSKFINCSGLVPEHFFNALISGSELPFGVEIIQSITANMAEQHLHLSKILSVSKRNDLYSWLDKNFPVTAPPSPPAEEAHSS